MEKYGPKIKEAIKSYMEDADINATGKTARSIYHEVFDTPNSIGIKIGGNKSFIVLHSGRRKGALPPPVASIKTWMQAKGIGPKKGKSSESAAFAIANAIGNNGYEGRNISYQGSLRIMNALLKDSSEAYIKDVEQHLKKSNKYARD